MKGGTDGYGAAVLPTAPHPGVQACIDRLAVSPRPAPLLRTPRLVLRPWQDRDRAPFAVMNADPEVYRFLGNGLDQAGSDALIERCRTDMARRGYSWFAVEHRESRGFVGAVGLSTPRWSTPFTPCVEIGWRLAPAFQHQGLAEEAAREVLRWGFEDLGFPQIVSFTVVDNERSWRLMERLGLSRLGEFAHPALAPEDPLSPHVLYALDRPTPAAVPAPVEVPARAAAPPPASARSLPSPVAALPHVWVDGDGAPRVIKELIWRAVERGAVRVTLVANRPVVVPRHRAISTVVVRSGLDVADDWIVAHAAPGELVITADVPLAAELVARKVEVLGTRGDWFTPSNVGERLSLRDFATEARAAGIVEGGGPAAFDDRSRRAFANGLDGWIQRKKRDWRVRPG